METIPTLGFGTYKLQGDIGYDCILFALKQGYNHIDTATLYHNEYEIGRAIKESKILRNELWITTKVQPRDISKGIDAIYNSISNSLKQLDTEYLDLVLLHGPVRNCLVKSWHALEEIILGNVEKFKDKVRFIGVSNYDIDHLEIILKNCRIKPYVNQIEVNPYLNRDHLIEHCNKNEIKVVAHTSLIKGHKFDDYKLNEISEELGISKPLLLLGWALNKGMIVLPRSSNPDHIKENMKCLNIGLNENTMHMLNELNSGYCLYPQPK